MKNIIYLIAAIIMLQASCTSDDEQLNILDEEELIVEIEEDVIIEEDEEVEDIALECSYENLTGKYMFFTETDTSVIKLDIVGAIDSFATNGISGYNFWFPAAPLSGTLNDCAINITPYTDVKRRGLPTMGGFDRWFYESMDGYGEFFPENDSIVLFINYRRTGDFTEDFSGNIYCKKVN